MFRFIKAHTVAFAIAGTMIVLALIMVVRAFHSDPLAGMIEAKVERGAVSEIVSVSGIIEATDTAELAFPSSGVVRQVLVREGDEVEAGDVLATLDTGTLTADLADAQAARASAIATRDELINGPTTEARDVTNTTVEIKRDTLARTISEAGTRVQNARRTLLSSGLEAHSEDPSENATAPTVSGTYSCDAEGTYRLEIFNSSARSGYSYRLSGLETGTYTVTTDQAQAFGNCGLRIQFEADESYTFSTWLIDIPNTKAAGYATNLNTYQLALTQQQNAVAAAEQDLALSEQQQILDNAAPRSEAITRANATIAQANARIARLSSQLEDRSIMAPFSGTITDVTVLPGETVATLPVITLLADKAFELTARIPEIDITKVAVGQRAEVVFDARASEVKDALITFISPLANEIDGVAYFEAKLQLVTPPEWIRSGLNADVDIIVEERRDVLRLPRRFVAEQNGSYYIQQRSGTKLATSSIEVGIIGNDGYIEVVGVTEGDTVVAP